MRVLLIVLIIASVLIVISISIIFPVVLQVKNNKA